MCFGKPNIQLDTTEGRFSAGDSSLYAKDNDKDHFCSLLINLVRDHNKMKSMNELGKKRISEELQ